MPRPANLLTKEQIEEFYVHGGMSLEETAAALGVGFSTVIRYMDRFGIPRRSTGARPMDVQDAFAERDRMIVEHHLAGWSMTRIAAKFQITKQRVSVIVKRTESSGSHPA